MTEENSPAEKQICEVNTEERQLRLMCVCVQTFKVWLSCKKYYDTTADGMKCPFLIASPYGNKSHLWHVYIHIWEAAIQLMAKCLDNSDSVGMCWRWSWLCLCLTWRATKSLNYTLTLCSWASSSSFHLNRDHIVDESTAQEDYVSVFTVCC